MKSHLCQIDIPKVIDIPRGAKVPDIGKFEQRCLGTKKRPCDVEENEYGIGERPGQWYWMALKASGKSIQKGIPFLFAPSTCQKEPVSGGGCLKIITHLPRS